MRTINKFLSHSKHKTSETRKYVQKEYRVKKNSWLPVFILIPFLCSGCIVLALSAGAAGGYAISKDEVEGFSDSSLVKVWQVGWEVLNREGAVQFADKDHVKIEAIVNDSKVSFQAEQVSPKSVRVQVKARKNMKLFPDIKLAQSLYLKIMKELK